LNVLVTGGAGYIGSHTVQELLRAGHDVVILDNFSSGHRAAVVADVVEADLGDRQALDSVLADRAIEGVIHLAAFAAAGESVDDPGKYFRNNVGGTTALLDAMAAARVPYLVFSSSCSVYGQPDQLPVTETAPTRPASPYGQSKLMCEQLFPWYEQAHGARSISLRYFNAAGAALDGSLGDDVRPPTRLVPIALEVALGKRPHLELFGTDYDTPDGSCVRDYVHVVDLATAHVRALEYLVKGGRRGVFNVGAGKGHSNRQVVAAVERATGRRLAVVERPRRPGDPARIYADNSKIRQVLGWEPSYTDLDTIIGTAWAWRRDHPDGYR
jgi:UDP-glucose 4-epimerase